MLIQLVNYPAQSSGSIVIKEKHQGRIVSEAMAVKHPHCSFAFISVSKCLRMLQLKFETKVELLKVLI